MSYQVYQIIKSPYLFTKITPNICNFHTKNDHVSFYISFFTTFDVTTNVFAPMAQSHGCDHLPTLKLYTIIFLLTVRCIPI